MQALWDFFLIHHSKIANTLEINQMSSFYDSNEYRFQSSTRRKVKKKDKNRQDDGNKKRMQNEQTEVVKLQDLWYNSLMSNCMHDLQRKLTHFMIC